MSAAEWEAVRLSAWVAGAAVLIGLPPGILLGWLLARRRFWGKTAVQTAVYLPLVLPPVVTGYLLLVTFGRNSPVGRMLEQWFGLRLVFDWKGAAVAAAVVSFPLLVRSVRTAFASVDRGLEDAARTQGATPLDVFFRVSLPLAMRGIVAGAVLAFARGLGEFGATIMIAGNLPGETRTIPLYVYDQLSTPGGVENAWPIIGASVVLAAAALAVGEHLERRVDERAE
ncbi:MAG: molybdate ABC transporter permease subunit [Planctomycetota bacterium]